MSAAEMRKRSGEVDSFDPVVALLYVLLWDHLPSADLEDALQIVASDAPERFEFTNGWLANYALDMRDRLAGKIETAERRRRREDL